MNFRRKQLVRHVKTGGVYLITGRCQLEATNAPAYLYRLFYWPDGRLAERNAGPLWARSAAEMEDGRFVAYGEALG